MVIDASALLAVLLNEPEANEFRLAIEADTVRLVSAATLLETAIVDRGTRRSSRRTRTGSPGSESGDRDRCGER